jgi:hypothetical protein
VCLDRITTFIENANHSVMGTAALEAAGILFLFSKISGVNRDVVIGIAVMKAHVVAVA